MDVSLIKLVLCGPGDVAKEIKIAQEVITEWNLQHGESYGVFIKHQHWSTDTHPELGDRPQAIINRQIIDEAKILVAIFWTRFGTPTGEADSGTEEEIRRGISQGKKVMVYFSKLEDVSAPASNPQTERLERFRVELKSRGVYGQFSSRADFRKEFARHLALKMNDFHAVMPAGRPQSPQSITGNHNVAIQAGRDVKIVTPSVKKIIERREGSVSPAELHQIAAWIEELAEGEVRMQRSSAFAKWGAIFKNTFKIDKREELLSSQMAEVGEWFRQSRAIQTRKQKTVAPDSWRRRRVAAIKAAMNGMPIDQDKYYGSLSLRLRMKKPFTSLTQLTKRDLERVYTMVMRDQRGY